MGSAGKVPVERLSDWEPERSTCVVEFEYEGAIYRVIRMPRTNLNPWEYQLHRWFFMSMAGWVNSVDVPAATAEEMILQVAIRTTSNG